MSPTTFRARSSVAERPAHNRLVPGSNPGGPTKNHPTINIALFAPEIPHNTGNIIRLCANVGASLHLIGPLGFDLYHPGLRRAALDYRDLADINTYDSWEHFKQDHPLGDRTFAAVPGASVPYTAPTYHVGDTLIFGPEGSGLPSNILRQVPSHNHLRIPMLENTRSLNLSNAVAVMAYEMWRQAGFAGAAVKDNPNNLTFS